eukprot:3725099-Rhodomonas_salina.4
MVAIAYAPAAMPGTDIAYGASSAHSSAFRSPIRCVVLSPTKLLPLAGTDLVISYGIATRCLVLT